MGKKLMHRMIAIFVAAVMIMACSLGAFAASSPTKGKVTSASSVGARTCKSLTISWKASKKADKYIVKVGDKTYTTTKTKLTVKTSKNSSLKITVTPVYNGKKGTAKKATSRWMQTTKVTKKTPGKKSVKLTWKKAKGATKYQVYLYKNGKWKLVKTVKGTSATIKFKKSGTYKFKVTPVKGSYIGIQSAVVKAKTK